MAIRKVALWCNRDKAEAPALARRLIAALRGQRLSVCTDEALARRLGEASGGDFSGADLFITIGGDGTLLAGLHEALRLNALMLGINLGHVGFLTEIEPDDIEQCARRLVTGDFQIETRMLVCTDYDAEALALNEVTVTRAPSSARILTMAVYADGQLIQRFSGDGLIVATPTGSTGYSLSAGGPLVAPGAELMLLTPICAHTPHAKPIVVPASARVEVHLDDQCEGSIAADGRCLGVLEAGEHIAIMRAQRRARFVRLREDDFFERLKSKLLDWGR